MPPTPNRPPRRPVTVVDVTRPTPRTVRVTVQGELADWPEPGPAAHMKVLIPDTPAGPIMRTYTVRHFDRDRGLVAIDFFLSDGAGPATRWAAQAAPGMHLEISGRARSTFTAEPVDGHYLFAGDETSLPAIATCLEALPETAHATVLVEIDDEHEEVPLTSSAAVDGRWLHRGAAEQAFAAAVLETVAASAYAIVWVACEAGTMREIRRALLDSGFPAASLKTRGYWKRGESNHPDHDTGDEIA